jgi:hypothetical protein
VQVVLNQPQQALQWLDIAVAKKAVWLSWVRVDLIRQLFEFQQWLERCHSLNTEYRWVFDNDGILPHHRWYISYLLVFI